MEHVIQQKECTRVCFIYEDKTIEFRKVKKGRVAESYIPKKGYVKDLFNSLINEEKKQKIKQFEIIPNYCITVNPRISMFTPPQYRKFKIKIGENIVKFECWLPSMVQIFKGFDVMTFAVDKLSKEYITENTTLYTYPLPNLYNNGSMCLGAASSFSILDKSFETIKKLADEQLFGVDFTTEVHSTYLFNDLIRLYNSMLYKDLGKKNVHDKWFSNFEMNKVGTFKEIL